MGSPIPTLKWRVFITIHGVKYYANRSVLTNENVRIGTGLDDRIIVRWKTMAEEYPDHFDYDFAYRIADKYSDQLPKLQEVRLQEEDA